MSENPQPEEEKEKSFFGIIVHSFFIIPFLITVFCLLLFASIKLLTSEQQTAFDLLEDVKAGGVTKRWQAAFELSKILANPELIPDDERFISELQTAFNESQHDDPRVRQYLALAMGRTGKEIFFKPLTGQIEQEREETLPAIIYALGMLGDKRATAVLENYFDHANSRIRSLAVVAVGNLKDPDAVLKLKKALNDSEANVQWGAAVSLAGLGNNSGEAVIERLLDRSYLNQFAEVTPQEQSQLILSAIEAAGYIKSSELTAKISAISQSDENMKVRAAAMDYLAK